MEFLKKIKIGIMVDAILTIVMGICFLLVPEATMNMFFKLAGVLLLIFGTVSVLQSFSADDFDPMVRGNVYSAALKIGLGLLFVIQSKSMVEITAYIFSVMLIGNGISCAQQALQMKKYNLTNWFIHLIIACVILVMGVVLAFNPFEAKKTLFIILAITLLLDGGNELFAAFRIRKITKKIEKAAAQVQVRVE